MAAFAVCNYGFSGSMLERMTHLPFYIVFVFSFGVAWGLLAMIRFFTIRFDTRYNWTKQFAKRFILQSLACWLLPMAIVFFLSMLFFAAIGVDILKTNYLHEDFLLTGLLLATCNILYVLAFFILRHYQLTGELHALKKRIAELEKQLETANNELEKVKAYMDRENAALKPYIINSSRAKTRYQYRDIAYFFMEQGSVMVKLMNGDAPVAANENSLHAVEENTGHFFRLVSRQYVIAPDAITKCIEKPDGGLLITLAPHNIEVEVSKKRTPELEDWILQKVSILRIGSN